MIRPYDHVFVLPTMKIAGGNLEVIRLAEDVRRTGKDVSIVSLWHTPNPISCEGIATFTLFNRPVNKLTALISIPLLLASFWRLVRHLRSDSTKFVFTHFTTYALVPLISKSQRWFFVQALEWYFVSAGLLRGALKTFITASYRTGHILVANRYLKRMIEGNALRVEASVDIWADSFFDSGVEGLRSFDIALVFRKGLVKRADWGTALLEKLKTDYPDLRVAVISPDEDFASIVEPNSMFFLRPTRSEMRAIYQQSRVFVLFSDHEGFGLPPLEAMGSGCVPVCRDAGGIRAYMEPELEGNIIPLDASPDAMIHRLVEILYSHDEWSRLSCTSYKVFRNGLHRLANRLASLQNCGFVDRASVPV